MKNIVPSLNLRRPSIDLGKYFARTRPYCKDYLDVVVPGPAEPVREIAIDAYCLSVELYWLGKYSKKNVETKRVQRAVIIQR